METITFTSTIAPDLITWVDKRARAEKKTRRAVLEEAVRRYQKTVVRENLKEGFARAAHDSDMFELAEWGMDDYARSLGRA